MDALQRMILVFLIIELLSNTDAEDKILKIESKSNDFTIAFIDRRLIESIMSYREIPSLARLTILLHSILSASSLRIFEYTSKK